MIGIIGSNGMLGSSIKSLCEFNRKPYKSYSREIVDFKNIGELKKILDLTQHRVIINTAAIININHCQEDPFNTEKINTGLPKFLAEYCDDMNIKLIHISTDHFYIGDMEQKHKENDDVCILNEYARQKYNAEYHVLKYKNTAVIRTSLLGYNNRKSSLLQWILNEIKYKNEIIGFTDSYTSALDVNFLSNLLIENFECLTGKLNISCKETYSKYDLIKEIIKITGSKCKLKKGTISGLSTQRADSTGLDCTYFMNKHQKALPDLSSVLNNLNIKEAYNEI